MAVTGRGSVISQTTPIVYSPFSIELWHRAPFLFCLQQILKITASEKEKAKKLPLNKYYFLPQKIVLLSQKIFIPKSSNDSSDCRMCSDNSSSNIMSSLVNHEKNNAQFVSYKQDQIGSNKFKLDYAWHIRWLGLLGMLLLVFSGGLWYRDFDKCSLISKVFNLAQFAPKRCKITILNLFSLDGGYSG